MKTVLQVRLLPDERQARLLRETFARFNAACNFVAERGFSEQVFGKYELQDLLYFEVRKRFGLNAQLAVRVIGKVAEQFRRDKTRKPVFKPRSAVVYDQRILSIKGNLASLSTVRGREKIAFSMAPWQAEILGAHKGQADLLWRKTRKGTKFLLVLTVERPEAEPIQPQDVLGVDLGIVNIATDSDGNVYSGNPVEHVRQRYAKLRAGLQSAGTRSAKRHLVKMSGREARFRKDVNHRTAKSLVTRAEGTSRAIALENLKGIRERITVRREQRARHCGWSFSQLRQFVAYKAKLAGVPVILVDPKNTSRGCSRCGHTEKANRKSQSEFVCRHCGHSLNADFNAARNIRARALVNAPIVAAGFVAG